MGSSSVGCEATIHRQAYADDETRGWTTEPQHGSRVRALAGALYGFA